jgi:hypothetical protein
MQFLTYSNGNVWIAYISREGSVMLACEHKSDSSYAWYSETNLGAKLKATSDRSPSIAVFDNDLYVAWRGQDSVIRYQRTIDGGTGWFPDSQKPKGSYTTSAAPILFAYKATLVLAWLDEQQEDDETYVIHYKTSTDGRKWSDDPAEFRPAGKSAGEKGDAAKSPYPPTFSIHNEKLYLFWGAGRDNDDNVFFANFDIQNSILAAPSTVDKGNWNTTVSNAVAYKDSTPSHQWIFSMDSDSGRIWVAADHHFSAHTNLSLYSPSAGLSATIIPGYMVGVSGATRPWKIVGVYHHSDYLYQFFIEI